MDPPKLVVDNNRSEGATGGIEPRAAGGDNVSMDMTEWKVAFAELRVDFAGLRSDFSAMKTDFAEKRSEHVKWIAATGVAIGALVIAVLSFQINTLKPAQATAQAPTAPVVIYLPAAATAPAPAASKP